MSPEQPLAWPRPETDSGASGAPTAERASSKNRSPAASVVAEDRAQDRVRIVREYVPRAPAWSTRIVRTEAEFEALRASWSALLAESENANVFMSHEWLHAWWTAYRPPAELAIALVEDGGEVRAIAPLMIERSRRAGLPVRVLRFIGDGTGETDHIQWLLAARDRDETLPRLLDAIGSLAWDMAEFNQVPAQSATAQALAEWIDRQQWPSETEASPCPVRRLPADFAALLASLPSRMRTSVRSSRRKLAEAHAVEFGLYQRPEELGAALESFFANHESRWQGKGIAGAFSNPRRRDFYVRLTPALLARGWLRFFYLKLDGRAVAQQYCFALDGTVMLLQEGFDFSRAQDNLGNVLRSHVFEHLIATGAQCYDFLAGSSRHKQSWSDGVVDDLKIRCARRSLKGALAFRLPRAARRLKDALRPWRDRWLHRSAEPHG